LHRRRLFERVAVHQIGGDAGCPEVMIAELGCDAGRRRAPADHRIGIRLRQHRAGELAGVAADRAEQRPLGIAAQACAVEIGGEVFLEARGLPSKGRAPRHGAAAARPEAANSEPDGGLIPIPPSAWT